MSNDVRIRVTSTNDTKATRAEVRRSFASMGSQAGNDFSRNLESAVKSKAAQVGDSAGKEFNKGLTRSSKGGAKDVGKDFASQLRDGVKGDLTATGLKLGEQFSAGFDEGTKKAGRFFSVTVYKNARLGLSEAGSELGREFSDSFDGKTTSAGKKTGSAIGKNITKEAENQVSGKAVAIGLGIEAALGPAGGVAGAAVAGGFGLALAGLAVFAGAQTQKVKDSFHGLTSSVSEEFAAIGPRVQAPISAALGYLKVQFTHLAPELSDDLVAVTPGIKIVSTGIADLANNAMPGLNSAAHQMGPVWMGIKVLLGDTGKAVGDLAGGVADHSASIGTDFGHVGDVIKGVVSLADHLVGQLSDDFAKHGGELTGAVNSIDSAITSLGTGAFPVLGNAIGGDLRLITGFFDVIGLGGPILGAFTGGLASAYTNVKLLGMLQSPLQGMAQKLKEAGTEGTTFGTATSKAGTFLGKLGDKLPLVGIGLTLISTGMEMASQHAQDLASEADDVAKGLEQGGGSATAARMKIDQWRQDVRDGQADLKAATATQDDYTNTMLAGSTGVSESAFAQQGANQKVDDANTKIKTALDSYNKYALAVGLAGLSTDQFTGKLATYDSSATNATSVTAQLAADALVLADNTATADQKVSALQDTLKLMSDQGLEKADDAIDKLGTTLGTFNDGLGTMKGKVFDNAGQLNSLSDAGRTVRKTIEDSRDAMVTYAQAAADAGVPQDQINAKLGSMAQALTNTIGPAVGGQQAAQGLLNTYHAMPGDITTRLHADTSGAQGVINSFIAMNNGRQIQIYTSILGSGGTGSLGRLAHGGVVGGAANGRTIGGGPTLVAEQGMERLNYAGRSMLATGPSLVNLPVGSTVTPHGNTMAQMAQAMGGNSGGGGGTLVIDAGDDMASQALLYLLRKAIRTQGGNVQAVLGR